MKSNINLDNIKVVVFDFDNTLAIHKDEDYAKKRAESEDTYFSYYSNAYLYPNIFYDEIEPCIRSNTLYNLIKILRSKNIKMYCLSGMKSSFHFNAKKHFISKQYGDDIELITVGNQELKVVGVKIIQKINNCKLDEILFIDDLKRTIKYLNDFGIKAINVNDIFVS